MIMFLGSSDVGTLRICWLVHDTTNDYKRRATETFL